MDGKKLCELCPRQLYQSGKRYSNHFNLVKTPCDHYFHPACWQRYYKTTILHSSCLCPTCHREVKRNAAVVISVSRDKTLSQDPIREDEHFHQLYSVREEARMLWAIAELENRSRRQRTVPENPGNSSLPRGIVQRRRATNCRSTSRSPFEITLIVLALLLVVVGCCWSCGMLVRC